MAMRRGARDLFEPWRAGRAARPGGAAPGAEHDPALEAIWDVVSAIPRGRAATYGGVARVAGLPGRARLVGWALKRAPEPLHLPWHRVVGAGGRIVFPPASRSHREQARRLRAEGVSIVKGRVASLALMNEHEW